MRRVTPFDSPTETISRCPGVGATQYLKLPCEVPPVEGEHQLPAGGASAIVPPVETTHLLIAVVGTRLYLRSASETPASATASAVFESASLTVPR